MIMRKKKKIRSLTKFVHGDEPLVVNANQHETGELLNWYSAVSQPDDRLAWAETYLKNRAMTKYLSAVKKNIRYMVPTALHLMRALDHGSTFEAADNVNAVILKELNHALTLSKIDDAESRAVDHAKKDLEGKAYWKIQDMIDAVLSGNEINPVVPNVKLTSQMRASFQSQLDELNDVKNSDQLQEGYMDVSDSAFVAAQKFLTELLETKQTAEEVKPKPVRVVKRREVDPAKKVSHLTYLREWNGVYSVKPTRILGAKTLVTYNTKNKMLSIFKSNSGFDVVRNKILNVESLVSRSVRHPDEVVSKIGSSTNIEIRQIFDGLKSKVNSSPRPMRPCVLILKVV